MTPSLSMYIYVDWQPHFQTGSYLYSKIPEFLHFWCLPSWKLFLGYTLIVMITNFMLLAVYMFLNILRSSLGLLDACSYLNFNGNDFLIRTYWIQVSKNFSHRSNLLKQNGKIHCSNSIVSSIEKLS